MLDVDPSLRTVRLNDADGEKVFRSGDAIVHRVFPDLQIPVDDIFKSLDRKW